MYSTPQALLLSPPPAKPACDCFECRHGRYVLTGMLAAVCDRCGAPAPANLVPLLRELLRT